MVLFSFSKKSCAYLNVLAYGVRIRIWLLTNLAETSVFFVCFMNLKAIIVHVSGLMKIGCDFGSLRIESWESDWVTIVERSSLEVNCASSTD